MMSTSTLLFLITCSQFLLSVQGLTLRLKGKEIVPDGGDVSINDLPVGGCRRYDTLECLSDVPYRGRVEEAHWVYTDVDTCEVHEVDDIHCMGDECKSPDIGWQSTLGIYKKGKRYYSVLRLGRRFETTTTGWFTCHFKEESNSVSVAIDCTCLTAPTKINAEIDNTTHPDYTFTTISWDAPCGGVDSYTIFYTNIAQGSCYNTTSAANETSHTFKDGREMQIAAHRNNKTKCSIVYDMLNSQEIDGFTSDCDGYCIEEK